MKASLKWPERGKALERKPEWETMIVTNRLWN